MAKSAKGAKAMSALVKKATEALRDPRVQAELLKLSKPAIDAIKKWAPSMNEQADSFGGRFGQRGLERRVENAQSAIAAVSSTSPELAAKLRPVDGSLYEVGHMLKVSANLPFLKRKTAHMKIDAVLDKLEAELFNATLGESPDD